MSSLRIIAAQPVPARSAAADSLISSDLRLRLQSQRLTATSRPITFHPVGDDRPGSRQDSSYRLLPVSNGRQRIQHSTGTTLRATYRNHPIPRNAVSIGILTYELDLIYLHIRRRA